MKEFEEYLKRIGKSENTALTYCRNIRMYFSWCRDSFGSEPKELYRSNVLEYISYMRNIRGYSPKSVNNHLSALRCLNKYLVQIGRQLDMADRISRDRDFLARVFQEILGIVCHEDGVSFDAGSIKIEPITVEKKYPGTRFYFTAHMDTIAYNMSVDIGFGDVVIPHPTTIDFPLLLSDIPSVNIQAYSLETVIAEKFHTMIDRDVLNSRMKDFFDCYQLLTKRNLNDDALYDAIEATFDNRGLAYNPDLQLFTDSFATDGARISCWKAFLRKIQWKEALDFDTVMKVIRDRLQPMAERYWIKLSK